MDKIEKIKSKLLGTVKNRSTNSEFIKLNKGYLIEERILLIKEVENNSKIYKLYLNDILIMEGSLSKGKKYFILPSTEIVGEYIYLDTLYKRVEAHNRKVLEDQLFNNIDVFLKS